MPSDKKLRGKRPKKRRFQGNQHAKECSNAKRSRSDSVSATSTRVSVELEASSSSSSDSRPTLVSVNPTKSELKLAYSEFYADKKQSDLVVTEGDDTDSDNDNDNRNDVVTDNVPQGHRIIDMDTLNTNISDNLVCTFCHSTIRLIEVSRHGLSSTLAFHCSNKKCDDQNAFPTYALISVVNLTIHSMNHHAVLAMHSIGRDRADLQSFYGVMDLPPPVHSSTYNKINETLEKAACTVQDQSMQRAAEREYAQADPIENDEVHDINV